MYVYIQKCIFWHIWCIGRRINRINISGQLMFSCYEKRFRRPKILTHQLLDSIGIWNLLFLFVIWWWRKSNCIAYHLLAFVIWFTFTFFLSSHDVFSESFVFLRFWKVWMKANSGFWLRVDQRSQSWYFSLYLSAIINCIHISL